MNYSLRLILILLFLVLLFIFNENFVFKKLTGNSMFPTLNSGDLIIINKNSHYKLHDIIVFELRDKLYVKRIHGLPGMKLNYRDGAIDFGQEMNVLELENWHFEYLNSPYDSVLLVPESHLFLLGDNIQESVDSRKLGFIKEGEIIGKVEFHF